MADPIPTAIQQTQIGFAPEISPYAQDLLGQTAALTDVTQNPYMQYQGDRVAQFSPLQQQAFENAALMQTAPQLSDATGLAGLAGLGALNTAYTYNPVTNQYSRPDLYQPGSFATDKVGTGSFTDAGVAQRYMNPYTDILKQEAKRQAGIAGLADQAGAVRSGAFGGARDFIQRSERNRALQQQLGGIDAAAYQQAMQQFNTETGLGLQAALANQQAKLAAQQQAEQSRQFGYGQQMGAAGQEAQFGQAAAQLNAQQGQFGAGLGLQGLQTALQGAGQLGNLGQTQYGQNIGINQLQAQYGLQQQQQAQNILNQQYQDYQNYLNYPYKQLAFMSDIIRGVPLSAQGSTVYQAAPTTIQNLTSLGLGAAGISSLLGKAEGGRIDENEGLRGGGLGAIALNTMV